MKAPVTEFRDDRGQPLTVGDTVVKTKIDVGAPKWASYGVVVGLGRTRVHVQWVSWHYDERFPHHAPGPHVLRKMPDDYQGVRR